MLVLQPEDFAICVAYAAIERYGPTYHYLKDDLLLG